MIDQRVWWFLSRASGITAWLLLALTVSWGVVLATRAFPGRRRPAWLLDLHRWLGTLTLVFTGVHVLTLLLDGYMDFTVADLTVPYWATWRPSALALGIFAGWGLVAVQVSSVAKRHLSKSVWRLIHLSSYAIFWLVTLHGASAGSDSTRPLYRTVAVLSIGLVCWATAYRLIRPGKKRSARPATR